MLQRLPAHPDRSASAGRLALLLLALAIPGPGGAQLLDSAGSPGPRTIGSTIDERERLAQLFGAPTRGALIRDGAMVLGGPTRGLSPAWAEVRVVSHSDLATPLNDGALWAGRGLNAVVRTGVAARWGRMRMTLAPELIVSENRAYETLQGRQPEWSRWSSPWRTREAPADLPLRLGSEPAVALFPGQSELAVRLSGVETGIASGNLWFGPGVRNALVLSDQAAGIPRFFLRSAAPWESPVGDVELLAFSGVLTESLFFDQRRDNDRRGVAALAVTVTPHAVPGLSLGLARLLVRRESGRVLARLLDPVTTWNGAAADDLLSDSTLADPLSSLFARWVMPDAHLEVWGEYGWRRLPSTPRDALTAFNADGAWTLGSQWAIPRRTGILRMQFETSSLEQSTVRDAAQTRDWYTGRAAIQGFTQRGQVLGAVAGPGGSQQWIALDRIRPGWWMGGHLARARWENDAMYREPFPFYFGHDVSVFAGLRGGMRWRALDVTLGWTQERRVNYLFESGIRQPLNRGRRSVTNDRLELLVSARPR